MSARAAEPLLGGLWVPMYAIARALAAATSVTGSPSKASKLGSDSPSIRLARISAHCATHRLLIGEAGARSGLEAV